MTRSKFVKAKNTKYWHDWRDDFLICPHLAEDPELAYDRLGFRACCLQCAKNGFLRASNLVFDEVWTKKGYASVMIFHDERTDPFVIASERVAHVLMIGSRSATAYMYELRKVHGDDALVSLANYIDKSKEQNVEPLKILRTVSWIVSKRREPDLNLKVLKE